MAISGRMKKRGHAYTKGVSLSRNKESNLFVCNNRDLERPVCNAASHTEKDKCRTILLTCGNRTTKQRKQRPAHRYKTPRWLPDEMGAAGMRKKEEGLKEHKLKNKVKIIVSSYLKLSIVL